MSSTKPGTFMLARPGFALYYSDAGTEKVPYLVYVPKNYPSAHINLSDETSRVLTIADISWKPNDNEMENVQFKNYDWLKWENLNHDLKI